MRVGGSSNTIGGTTSVRNLISANTGDGVGIFAGAANNQVAGNLIGTNSGGTGALGNGIDGVAISGAARPATRSGARRRDQ